MGSFSRRLAITILVPLALALLGDRLTLPGVPAELVERSGGSRGLVSIFALGITPFLSAYWLVELTAIAVPRWSHLRNGNSQGRAKLERAGRLVGLVFAILQGFGMALSLEALGMESAKLGLDVSISKPIVAASIVGGACIQFLAAQLITRRGLLNGFVALVGAGAIRTFVEGIESALGFRPHAIHAPPRHLLEPRALAMMALALVAIGVASWAVLRGSGDPATMAPDERQDGPPYRSVRRLVARPWIPIPSSSYQPYAFATSLLMIPYSLTNLQVPLHAVTRFLDGNGYYLALVAVLVVTVVLFARLMHRPGEMAELSRRLGVSASDATGETRAALRRTYAPTLLFFGVVVLTASTSDAVGVPLVPVLVAMTIDLARSIRIERARADLVTVWEERKASAVPVLCAALAAEGIAVDARGMAVLSLWQVFAPYAPVELRVRREDAERAAKTLRHLVLGEEAPERTEAAPAPATPPQPRPSRAPVMAILGGCAAAAAVAVAVVRLPMLEPAGDPGPRAKLEVVRVDDTIDPFAAVRDEDIPAGAGIDIYQERAPVGPGRSLQTHFARMVFRAGESKAAATARLRSWLATIALPAGARFGLEEVTEHTEETQTATSIGLRTFVIFGEPVLRTDDVTDAIATESTDELSQTYVAVTLSNEGANRFEVATRAWIQRRLAIIIDDEIDSAPVVKTAIRGGHISITIGAGDPEAQMKQAQGLARRLRGR